MPRPCGACLLAAASETVFKCWLQFANLALDGWNLYLLAQSPDVLLQDIAYWGAVVLLISLALNPIAFFCISIGYCLGSRGFKDIDADDHAAMASVLKETLLTRPWRLLAVVPAILHIEALNLYVDLEMKVRDIERFEGYDDPACASMDPLISTTKDRHDGGRYFERVMLGKVGFIHTTFSLTPRLLQSSCMALLNAGVLLLQTAGGGTLPPEACVQGAKLAISVLALVVAGADLVRLAVRHTPSVDDQDGLREAESLGKLAFGNCRAVDFAVLMMGLAIVTHSVNLNVVHNLLLFASRTDWYYAIPLAVGALLFLVHAVAQGRFLSAYRGQLLHLREAPQAWEWTAMGVEQLCGAGELKDVEEGDEVTPRQLRALQALPASAGAGASDLARQGLVRRVAADHHVIKRMVDGKLGCCGPIPASWRLQRANVLSAVFHRGVLVLVMSFLSPLAMVWYNPDARSVIANAESFDRAQLVRCGGATCRLWAPSLLFYSAVAYWHWAGRQAYSVEVLEWKFLLGLGLNAACAGLLLLQCCCGCCRRCYFDEEPPGEESNGTARALEADSEEQTPAATGPQAEVWVMAQDQLGSCYYYSLRTQARSRDPPPGVNVMWEHRSKGGMYYYYNRYTKESRTERPPAYAGGERADQESRSCGGVACCLLTVLLVLCPIVGWCLVPELDVGPAWVVLDGLTVPAAASVSGFYHRSGFNDGRPLFAQPSASFQRRLGKSAARPLEIFFHSRRAGDASLHSQWVIAGSVGDMARCRPANASCSHVAYAECRAQRRPKKASGQDEEAGDDVVPLCPAAPIDGGADLAWKVWDAKLARYVEQPSFTATGSESISASGRFVRAFVLIGTESKGVPQHLAGIYEIAHEPRSTPLFVNGRVVYRMRQALTSPTSFADPYEAPVVAFDGAAWWINSSARMHRMLATGLLQPDAPTSLALSSAGALPFGREQLGGVLRVPWRSCRPQASRSGALDCQNASLEVWAETGSDDPRCKTDVCYSCGRTQCLACAEGFSPLPRSGGCVASRRCSCENGVPSVGDFCSSKGAHSCFTCYRGFHLADGSCERNSCVCEHGEAAEGLCPVNGGQMCQACADGFHLHDAAGGLRPCRPNACTCANGVAVAGTACPAPSADGGPVHKCSKCKPGYELSGSRCEAIACTCKHGIPSPDCVEEIYEKCLWCSVGYHLVGSRCQENRCSCENGRAASGRHGCERNGTEACGSCEPGFSLVDRRCKFGVPLPEPGKPCTCRHGRPEGNSTCSARQEKCASCERGYHVTDWGSCDVNRCFCSHGLPATGPDCEKDGSERCVCHGGRCKHVRLVGGEGTGRLEVQHEGKWGTVCKVGFEEAEAKVVCRELGFTGTAKVLSPADVPDGEGSVWLSGMQCQGNESNLLACPTANHRWGVREDEPCDHTTDVGVRCELRGGRPTKRTGYGTETIVGRDGENGCPPGAEGLTEQECRALTDEFGGELDANFLTNEPGDPKGCFRFGTQGRYYYNTHGKGQGRPGRAILCKTWVAIEYDVGEAVPGGCPAGAGPLREGECRSMPAVFGGRLADAFGRSVAGDPGGCFRYKGLFYFNPTPGRGEVREGRVPYCKRPYGVDYVASGDGLNECPPSAEGLTLSECRSLPSDVGGRAGDPFLEYSDKAPKGCFRYGQDGVYFFNAHPKGQAQEKRTPICKRAPHVDGLAGEDGHNDCPPTAARLTVAECQSLPAKFGGKLRTPFVVDDAREPKGCFARGGLYGFNRNLQGHSRAGSIPQCKREHFAKFVAGQERANECPSGSARLSITECQALPAMLGGDLSQPFVMDHPGDPKGCFRAGPPGARTFTYNLHYAGVGQQGSVPYCKTYNRAPIKLSTPVG